MTVEVKRSDVITKKAMEQYRHIQRANRLAGEFYNMHGTMDFYFSGHLISLVLKEKLGITFGGKTMWWVKNTDYFVA
jgi:hypothetical protein